MSQSIFDRVNSYVESRRAAHQRSYCRGLLHPQGLSDEETQKFLDAAAFLGRAGGQWASDGCSLRTMLASPPDRRAWSQMHQLIGYPPALNEGEKLEWPNFSTPPEPPAK